MSAVSTLGSAASLLAGRAPSSAPDDRAESRAGNAGFLDNPVVGDFGAAAAVDAPSSPLRERASSVTDTSQLRVVDARPEAGLPPPGLALARVEAAPAIGAGSRVSSLK